MKTLPDNFLQLRNFWLKIFLVLIVAISIYVTMEFWVSLIISIALAFVLNPFVEQLGRIKIGPNKFPLPRFLAIILAFILASGFFIISLVFIIFPLLAEIDKLSLSLPQLAGNIRENLLQLQLLLPDNINSMLNQTINQAEMYIANFIHNTIKAIFEFLSNALQIIIVPVLTFYFIKDGRKIRDNFLSILPLQYQEKCEEYFDEVQNAMSAYVRGLAKLSLIAGTVITAYAFMIDIDYPLVLGLLAAFAEALPIIGPILAVVPAIILTVIHMPDMIASVACFYLIFNQIDSNIIIPKVMGNAIKLHPTMIIFSLLVGAKLFGILGMVFAVPVTAFLKISFKHIFFVSRG